MNSICDMVCLSTESEICMDLTTIQHRPQNSSPASEDQTNRGFISFKSNNRFQRSLRQCEITNQLFTDSDFPPCFSSLKYQAPGRTIIWQRISTLSNNLIFMEDDISTLKIEAANPKQAYFLSTISALAKDNGKALIFEKVFPREWYPIHWEISKFGIYRLIVKIHGVATEVCIDDWIPVYKESGRPVFSKLISQSIWVLLLEKAWAKLKGSYNAMLKGSSFEVLNTFCLAPTVRHSLNDLNQDQKQELWRQITQDQDSDFIICATTKDQTKVFGLLDEKIYSVQSWYQSGITDKRIYFHNIACKIQSQSSIGFPVQNNIFSLSYQTFLINFESIDINCTKAGYYFDSGPDEGLNFNIISGNPKFLQLNILSIQNIYITIEKFRGKCKSASEYIYKQDYGQTRIILSKVTNNERLIYVDSQLETSLSSVTFKCKSLESGRYIIMVDADYPKIHEFNLAISCYSDKTQRTRKMKVIEYEYLHFMNEVMLDHALRLCKTVTYVPQDFENSWLKINVLLREGGYAYVVIKSGRFKMNIKFDQKYTSFYIEFSNRKVFI